MATAKQIAANRANARKSTGPVTSEGKAKAARNGFRNCPVRKAINLGNEKSRLLRELERRFHAAYQPKGPAAAVLVDTIVACSWRLFRIWHIERAGIDYEIRRQVNPGLAPDPS